MASSSQCTLPNHRQWRRRPYLSKPISPSISIPDQSSLHNNMSLLIPLNLTSSSGEIASQVASSAAEILRGKKEFCIRDFVEFVKEIERGGVRAVGVLDGKIMDEVRRECWRVVKDGGCGNLEFVEAMETLKGDSDDKNTIFSGWWLGFIVSWILGVYFYVWIYLFFPKERCYVIINPESTILSNSLIY